MEGERACDRPLGRRVQQPLVEHELRAVVTLLAGLEHEAHAAGQLLASNAQEPRRVHEHRRVEVVAAGVHGVVDP